MSKFEDHRLLWTAILGRFEAHSHQTYTHQALVPFPDGLVDTGKSPPTPDSRASGNDGQVKRVSGIRHIQVETVLGWIGSLKDDGRDFWPEGAPQLERWERGCTELGEFLSRLGTRRDLKNQDLATAMREFIQEFEHHTERMYQMLSEPVDGSNNDDERLTQVFDWMNLVFRSSIYALLSGWIEDKQDDFLTTITINLATGESSQETTGTGMKVPKKYQRATKRI